MYASLICDPKDQSQIVFHFRLNKGYNGRTEDVHTLCREDLVKAYGVDPEGCTPLQTIIQDRTDDFNADVWTTTKTECTLIPFDQWKLFADCSETNAISAAITKRRDRFSSSSRNTSSNT